METTRRALLAAAGGSLFATTGCLGSVTGGSGGGGCDLSARDEVQSLPVPSIGPDDAAVTVIAFEDFACPHCRTYHLEEFPSIESELVGDGVRYEHYDFPIPVSQKWSWAAASAARAVQDATDDATFFDYSKALFEEQDSYSMSVVQSLAADVGADGCDVRAAAENERYRPVLETTRQHGVDLGVRGTPTVFVNGQSVTATFDDVRRAVEGARS